MEKFKTIIYDALYKSRDRAYREYNNIARQQRLDEEKINKMQMKKLHDICAYAADKVPYYKRIIKKSELCVGPGEINYGAFRKLPILTKEILFNNYDSLIADAIDKRGSFVSESGGSTGTPVKFIQDKEYQDKALANKILYDAWAGYEHCQKKILLWGSMHDVMGEKESLRQQWGRWIKNEIWLDSFYMDDKIMEDYLEIINKNKPKLILAYAESIYELAKFIEKNDKKVFSPTSIMTSAGTLYPSMRGTIERIFNCPVFNRYGCREVGDIACECEVHKGLHVNPFTHYVEILKKDGSLAKQGEMGEVVVTSLSNFSMPLIRYALSDLAEWGESACSCGRNWPLIGKLYGRVSDSFVTRDGKIINSLVFYPIFADLESTKAQEWIKQFQVIQESYDNLRVLIVTHDSAKENIGDHSKDIDTIAKKIKVLMGAQCNIDFEVAKSIPPVPSGKRRYMISKVTNEMRENTR